MLLHPCHRPFHTLFSSNILLMGSKQLLKSSPCSLTPISSFSLRRLYTYRPQLFSTSPSKPLSNFTHFSQKKFGFCYAAHPEVIQPVNLEHREGKILDPLSILKVKLENQGIQCDDCKPGEYSRLICPECEGGDSRERSFSLFIDPDGNVAMWQCFRAKCGFRGHVKGDESGRLSYGKVNQVAKVKSRNRVITEESIGLEPLCDELLAYFAERMISGETLRRNAVMQRSGEEVAIAFTYRRNGVLVSCKYRDINKKFWQEKNTEKILYGLDDIKEASDIIIVEGEMDKLSMEEAGFRNCVSVPDGAPAKVSGKELPSEEEVQFNLKIFESCSLYLNFIC